MNVTECVEYLKSRDKSVWIIREVAPPNRYYCGRDFRGCPILESCGVLSEQYERKIHGLCVMRSLDKSEFELVNVLNNELMVDKAVAPVGYIVKLQQIKFPKWSDGIFYLGGVSIKDLDVVSWGSSCRDLAYVFTTFNLAKNVVDIISKRVGVDYTDMGFSGRNLTPQTIEEIHFSDPHTSTAIWNIVEGLLYQKVEK